MLYKDLINKAKNKYNAEYLLKNYINLNTEELNNRKHISIFKIAKFKAAMLKSNNKPLQYIIGNVNFCGYIYKVNKNVLIPRFETEQLVEETIKIIKKEFNKENISILDLCTGSGCIGITLKKELINVNVTLSDISKKALKVAKYNSKGEKIKIIHSDIFKNIEEKYDVIISNPPYLSYKDSVESIVKDNEPNIALYAKNNGLYFYEGILKNIKKVLKNKYIIAFEIGETQADKIINIVNRYLKNIDILVIKDLNNRDRILIIKSKKIV